GRAAGGRGVSGFGAARRRRAGALGAGVSSAASSGCGSLASAFGAASSFFARGVVVRRRGFAGFDSCSSLPAALGFAATLVRAGFLAVVERRGFGFSALSSFGCLSFSSAIAYL